MHEEIFTDTQRELLPLVQSFSPKFNLVGGTAVALQIGHRRSVDFDLFSEQEFDNSVIADQVARSHSIEATKTDMVGHFTFYISGVQFTFLKYRFSLSYPILLGSIVRMPDLLTLGAMKLHALGRRAKWKDYVDLYFILKQHSITELIDQAKRLFGGEINERDVRAQLAYFYDMDYSERVEFLPGFEVPGHLIKKYLQEISLQ